MEAYRRPSFLDIGRDMEIEAVEGRRECGCLSESPSQYPTMAGTDDDREVAFRSVAAVQEATERLGVIDQYVAYAESAFQQRSLLYPFLKSPRGDWLEMKPGHSESAQAYTQIRKESGIGKEVAKRFEVRAAEAVQRLVGGRGICVGAPRRGRTGVAKACDRFRSMLPEMVGSYEPRPWPRSGDMAADGFWVLGRCWGGPVLYLQVKNTAFDLDAAPEFLRCTDAYLKWFGRRPDRTLIKVFAVNDILTLEQKGQIHLSTGDAGIHVLDVVDMMCADHLGDDELKKQCVLTVL